MKKFEVVTYIDQSPFPLTVNCRLRRDPIPTMLATTSRQHVGKNPNNDAMHEGRGVRWPDLNAGLTGVSRKLHDSCFIMHLLGFSQSKVSGPDENCVG